MAKKTLRKMLDDSAAASGATEATKRLAVFLAYWEEMEEAYRQGWSWLQIYRALFQEEVFDFSYSTFLYYKNKRRRREQKAAKPDAGAGRSNDAKPAPAERPARTPGSGRAELPVFKDVTRDRDDKWF